jgi:hypothetical protein
MGKNKRAEDYTGDNDEYFGEELKWDDSKEEQLNTSLKKWFSIILL